MDSWLNFYAKHEGFGRKEVDSNDDIDGAKYTSRHGLRKGTPILR